MAVVYIPTGYTFSLSHFVSLISFLRLLFSYILSRRQHTICPARHKNRNKANEFCYRRGKGGDCPPLLDSAQLSAHPGHIPPLPEIRCLSKQEAARVGTCRHHPTQYTAHQYRQLFVMNPLYIMLWPVLVIITFPFWVGFDCGCLL
jgi:hypothetical protein